MNLDVIDTLSHWILITIRGAGVRDKGLGSLIVKKVSFEFISLNATDVDGSDLTRISGKIFN